jgi:hypothetical protein
VPVYPYGYAGWESSIALQQWGEDLRPVISYLTGSHTGALYVTRPTVTDPLTADDWIHCHLVYGAASTAVTVAGNLPVVVYHSTYEDALLVAGATTPEFYTASDFQVFTLREGVPDARVPVGATAVDDVPMIAFQDPATGRLAFGYRLD